METWRWVHQMCIALVVLTETIVVFEPHARVRRTLSDGFHAAGLEMAAFLMCVRHHRTMGNTTGTVVTVVTGGHEGFSHRDLISHFLTRPWREVLEYTGQ